MLMALVADPVRILPVAMYGLSKFVWVEKSNQNEIQNGSESFSRISRSTGTGSLNSEDESNVIGGSAWASFGSNAIGNPYAKVSVSFVPIRGPRNAHSGVRGPRNVHSGLSQKRATFGRVIRTWTASAFPGPSLMMLNAKSNFVAFGRTGTIKYPPLIGRTDGSETIKKSLVSRTSISGWSEEDTAIHRCGFWVDGPLTCSVHAENHIATPTRIAR